MKKFCFRLKIITRWLYAVVRVAKCKQQRDKLQKQYGRLTRDFIVERNARLGREEDLREYKHQRDVLHEHFLGFHAGTLPANLMEVLHEIEEENANTGN